MVFVARNGLLYNTGGSDTSEQPFGFERHWSFSGRMLCYLAIARVLLSSV
jgi:crotonobetainyl-CoA:carnitine CoA-transferase CaiB-like acyl-CoA transferase